MQQLDLPRESREVASLQTALVLSLGLWYGFRVTSLARQTCLAGEAVLEPSRVALLSSAGRRADLASRDTREIIGIWSRWFFLRSLFFKSDDRPGVAPLRMFSSRLIRGVAHPSSGVSDSPGGESRRRIRHAAISFAFPSLGLGAR